MTTRGSTLAVLLAALPLLAPPGAGALEMEGVQVPDTARLADGTALVLNGAGTRTKFVFDVYVGALYLPAKTTDAAAVLAAPVPNRVLMHFVYDEVDAESLREAWTDGFEANHTAEQLEALRPRLERFNALFTGAVEGDRFTLDFVPGAATEVSRNGEVLGRIEGDDFNRALLAVWLGRRPADARLKEGMLGE